MPYIMVAAQNAEVPWFHAPANMATSMVAPTTQDANTQRNKPNTSNPPQHAPPGPSDGYRVGIPNGMRESGGTT